MSTTEAPTPASSSDALPYVGLRPFEAHEGDRFFGRDRDTDLLCDKIMSGRLTILYAHSGLGKSSLLRAAVIPRLEANHGRVIYFDAWAQEDPLGLLKDALIRTAGGLGIPQAGRGSPTLTELARLLCSVDGRGLILVLDQFEEFLVHHGQALDAVRGELAGLLRASKLDATVVLSLREDFLASLEPLRQEILNLFQSTYRLEGLREDGLRLAITEPARLFGGGCTPELTERLVRDLHGSREAGATAGLHQAVELPMLQLVCQELWRTANRGQLTVALYEEQGGAQRILDDYVRGLMPKRSRDQSFTARLLLHLAPPSGLKMSYAAGDLSEMTGLDPSRVEGELDRLARARLLRARDYRGGLRYELQHDAFIPVLKEWRARVLERERRLTWTNRLVTTSACVGLLVTALFWVHHYNDAQEARLEAAKQNSETQALQQQRQQKDFELNQKLMRGQLESSTAAGREAQLLGRLEKLRRQLSEREAEQLKNWQSGGMLEDLRLMSPADRNTLAPARFEMVTYNVLWREAGGDRLGKLRDVLERYADLLPDDYAMASAPVKIPEPAAASWPLRLEHSDLRPVSADGFTLMWQDLRRTITGEWAIPTPTTVRLQATKGLARDKVRIVGENGKAVSVTIPTYEDGSWLVMKKLEELPSGPARDFINHYGSEWKPFTPASADYKRVPKWSLPVWKLAGVSPMNEGAMVAYVATIELLKTPEPLFSSQAVETLLDHAAKSYPNTVAEARAARGNALGTELTARVQGSRVALSALPKILDELADLPNPSAPAYRRSDAVSALAPSTQSTSGVSGQGLARRNRLGGPWPTSVLATKSDTSTTGDRRAGSEAYWDLDAELADFPLIRIYVSPSLVPGWFPGGQLSKALAAGIEGVKKDVYIEYGVESPAFRFRPFAEGNEPARDMIQVDVPGGTLRPAVNLAGFNSGPEKLDSLYKELRSAVSASRVRWVTAESTAEVIKALPPNTRDWLEKHYSLTDMKRIMRFSTASTAMKGGGRYPSWLLSTLPFWALVDDPLDAAVVGGHIQDTVRGRTETRRSADSVRLALERGAEAMVADDVSTATTAFQTALNLYRTVAVEAFPGVWATQLRRVVTRDLARKYPSLDHLSLSTWELLDLQELGTSETQRTDGGSWWEVALYRLAAGQVTDASRQNQIMQDLLSRSGEAERLPEHARWLALRFLKQYNPLDAATGGVSQLNEATSLFTSALRRLDESTALDTFAQLASLAQTGPAPNWAWRLLDETAKLRQGEAADEILLELAWRLCHEERPDRLRSSLALLEEYERLTAGPSPAAAKREERAKIITYVRAHARAGLLRLGNGQPEAVEPLLRDLLAWEREDIRKEVYLRLAQFLTEQGRAAEGEKVAAQATEKWPGTADFLGPVLYSRLRTGDTKGLVALSRLRETSSIKAPDDERASWLFVESLAATMVQAPKWDATVEDFMAVQHPNSDYIRMLAYGFGGGASSPWAAKLLRERWAEIKPESWPARMAAGDASAWREMLIGRFMDAPASSSLFTTLADNAKWEGSLLAQLPASRAGLECEAWFYEAMKAKAEGQKERMLECLRRCIATGFNGYFEYAMAGYLLAGQS